MALAFTVRTVPSSSGVMFMSSSSGAVETGKRLSQLICHVTHLNNRGQRSEPEEQRKDINWTDSQLHY